MRPQANRPPMDVMRALETLEGATSPVELGPAYAAVLNWKNVNAPPLLHWRTLTTLLSALAPINLLSVINRVQSIPEFWQGFLFAVVVMLIVQKAQRIFSKEPSFAKRVETALDRWRHLIPAMRQRPPNE